MGEVLEGALGALPVVGSVVQSVASSREAKKNREFQERMSSTAHQREVADLRAAGLNPLLSVMRGSGASTPSGAVGQVADFGESAAKGIQAVLARRQAEANIELTRANTAKAQMETGFLSESLQNRLREVAARTDMSELEAQQLRETMPDLIRRARAEVDHVTNSARAARASAILDELARNGAYNQAEFDRMVGKLGPAGRALSRALSSLGAGAVGGALISRAMAKGAKPGRRLLPIGKTKDFYIRPPSRQWR